MTDLTVQKPPVTKSATAYAAALQTQNPGKLLGQYTFMSGNGIKQVTADVFAYMTTEDRRVVDSTGNLVTKKVRLGVMRFVHEGRELFCGTISEDNRDKAFGVPQEYLKSTKAEVQNLLHGIKVEQGLRAFNEILASFGRDAVRKLAQL